MRLGGARAGRGDRVQAGLGRYWFCPTNKCFNQFKMGCSANYGKYIVDVTIFLQLYIVLMI